MEHPNSKDPADESLAGAGIDNSVSPTGSPAARPTAIERQIAATAGLGYGNQTHRETADRAARRESRRFGLAGFFILLLLVAAGPALLFIDSGRFADTGRSLQKIGGAIQRVAGQVIYNNDSLPVAHSSSTPNPAAANAAPTVVRKEAPKEVPKVVPKEVAEVSTPAALSLPVADISLRNRPELLKQLVQVYRTQLADDPNNATARAALNQLQERSLSELQTIILEENDAVAVKSMELVSRLFPEAADSVRYKYLVARVDRMHGEGKEKPIAKSESTTPATATLPKPASTPSESVSPEKSTVAAVSSANSSPAINKAAEHAGKTAGNAVSSKPEIRAVSITPGAMVHDRFVPNVEGNAFMVEISYRNFDRIAEDQSVDGETGVSLVARLGVPGYSNVLAEAPVEILGDRGTKSFVMTTLMPAGDSNEYKLNFILNGEFLASRTVRVTR